MSWITQIQIENFRAFSTPETIKIATGQHLLIYGENGSGKSSIFKALRDFFLSASTNTGFSVNQFLSTSGNISGSVGIEIDNATPPLVFNSNPALSTNSIPAIIQSGKIKGFLDYKNILKAHALNVNPGENPNFFDFLIGNILADHSVANPAGGVGQVRLLEEYKRIKNILLSRYSNSHAYQNAESELDALNLSLFNNRTPKGLLNKVFTIANWYLRRYFKTKIKVNAVFTPMAVYKEHQFAKKEIVEEINFDVYYGNRNVTDFPSFLNEARLSALAMSIFLASLKIYPVTLNELKVIFLDDVFIGLDNSNRIPLLEIIKNEFISNNWQIIISTYDRQWFELCLQWLTSQRVPCKQIQMFNETSTNPNVPDKPIIIQEGLEYVSRARKYFEAKDYFAAGNYLRKEAERIIKQNLPNEYRMQVVEPWGSDEITQFEALKNNLVKYYDDCSIIFPQNVKLALDTYQKAVLNPTSHDDSASPVYRIEILKAFEVVAQLNTLTKIERKLVLSAGSRLTYNNAALNYVVEIESINPLFRVFYHGGDHITEVKYKLVTWNYKGVLDSNMNAVNNQTFAEPQLTNIKNQIRTKSNILQGIFAPLGLAIPNINDFETIFNIGSTGTLANLISMATF
jgi:energy-coupling factor transporter ATP-binding protein EcfA2